jgi:hypothetical protein
VHLIAVHRTRDLGEGRTLAFERDLHGDVTGAYVSHYDAQGKVCLTRLTIATFERPGGPRAYRLLTIDPVTLDGPPIVCNCGTAGRVRAGRWLGEPSDTPTTDPPGAETHEGGSPRTE